MRVLPSIQLSHRSRLEDSATCNGDLAFFFNTLGASTMGGYDVLSTTKVSTCFGSPPPILSSTTATEAQSTPQPLQPLSSHARSSESGLKRTPDLDFFDVAGTMKEAKFALIGLRGALNPRRQQAQAAQEWAAYRGKALDQLWGTQPVLHQSPPISLALFALAASSFLGNLATGAQSCRS